jgi:hypothetical protein
LGVGHAKKRLGLNLVGGALVGHNVTNVSCGDTFTICATSENHIFSFGNRKDGRLGLESGNIDLETNTLCCLPKPIFGSLHLVSDMSSKGWNSIIIAEKILNTKPVRNISYMNLVRRNLNTNSGSDNESGAESFQIVSSSSDYDSSNQLNMNNYNLYDEITNQQERNLINNVCESFEDNNFYEQKIIEDNGSFSQIDDDVPDWLKKESENADFIPLQVLEQKMLIESNKKSSNIVVDAYCDINSILVSDFL